MARILCVEDTPEVRLIIQATLSNYQVVFADTMAAALPMIEKDRFDLVLMDIELPDGNGLEIFATTASLLRGVPVFFLTGHLDFASKAAAFSLGADDFIVKPFDPRDLRLRVDSKLRKMQQEGSQTNQMRIGDLVCHLEEQRVVRSDGTAYDLTALEFRLFYLLAKTPQKIFTRAEILDRVWGQNVSVTDRAVDVHISNLRKKIVGSSVTIEAVVGSGYRIQVVKK
ncbi:response regulator transcription factor [soil metagenome]